MTDQVNYGGRIVPATTALWALVRSVPPDVANIHPEVNE